MTICVSLALATMIAAILPTTHIESPTTLDLRVEAPAPP